MGLLYSLCTESFPPSSHFTANDIPDLSGKVTIVTGANTGTYLRVALDSNVWELTGFGHRHWKSYS